MKKYLYILLLLTISLFSRSYSQVMMTEGDFPNVGEEFIVGVAPNILLADPSKTGANYFWNYSFMKADETYTATFVNPFFASPIYLIPFFDADYGVPGEPLVDLSTVVKFEDPYNFYKKTSSSIEYLGFGGKIAGGAPFPFRWFDSDKLFDLPLEYGNSGIDSSFWVVNIPTLVYLEREQTRSYAVDGWGTLRLPKGDFDVIKVRSYIQSSDTTYIDSIDTGIRIPTISTIRYQWFSPGFPNALLEIDMFDVLGLPVFSRATFYDGPFVVNLDDEFSTPDVIWAYDHFGDLFTIKNKTNESVSARLIDMNGRTLVNFSLEPGMNTQMSSTTWSSGVYFLQYMIGNESHSDKILINH